jgi:hypothetical protein
MKKTRLIFMLCALTAAAAWSLPGLAHAKAAKTPEPAAKASSMFDGGSAFDGGATLSSMFHGDSAFDGH